MQDSQNVRSLLRRPVDHIMAVGLTSPTPFGEHIENAGTFFDGFALGWSIGSPLGRWLEEALRIAQPAPIPIGWR